MSTELSYRPRFQALSRIIVWSIIVGFVLSVITVVVWPILRIHNSFKVYKPTPEQRAEIERLTRVENIEGMVAEFLLVRSERMRDAAMSVVHGPGLARSDHEPSMVITKDVLADVLLHTAWIGGFETNEYDDLVYHRAVWTNQQMFERAVLRGYEAGTLQKHCDFDRAYRALWNITQPLGVDTTAISSCQELLEVTVRAIEAQAGPKPQGP